MGCQIILLEHRQHLQARNRVLGNRQEAARKVVRPEVVRPAQLGLGQQGIPQAMLLAEPKG